METIAIREATMEDKDAILSIDDVYSGADYLKEYFDDFFINCPHTKTLVALHNSEIIGFMGGLVVDGGLTVVSRGGRIKPRYASRGVVKKLLQHIMRLPGVSRIAFTTVNTHDRINTFIEKHYQISLTRSWTRYDFAVDTVDLSLEDRSDASTLKQLTKDNLSHCFTDPAYREYLFPNGRILVDWVPYMPMVSNIPILWTREANSHRVSDVCVKDGAVKGLMSISTTYNGPGGLFVCQLDIFGADNNSIRRHIVSHMNYICSKADDTVTIEVMNDLSLDKLAVRDFLKSFGLKEAKLEGVDFTGVTELYLLEQIISVL